MNSKDLVPITEKDFENCLKFFCLRRAVLYSQSPDTMVLLGFSLVSFISFSGSSNSGFISIANLIFYLIKRFRIKNINTHPMFFLTKTQVVNIHKKGLKLYLLYCYSLLLFCLAISLIFG